MNRKNNRSNTHIVFSKWSGKGYAIFASLHKEVQIAQLKISICKQAVKKNIKLISKFVQLDNDELNQQSDDPIEFLLSEILMLNLIPIEATASQAIPHSKNKIEIYIQDPCFAAAIHGFFNCRNHGKSY